MLFASGGIRQHSARCGPFAPRQRHCTSCPATAHAAMISGRTALLSRSGQSYGRFSSGFSDYLLCQSYKQERHMAANRLSVLRARLPHMDEEIEHMQWQLDKRTHDEAGGVGNHHNNRHKPGRPRLVFHDRNQHRHSNQHKHHQHSSRARKEGFCHRSSSSSSPGSGSDSFDEGSPLLSADTVLTSEQLARQQSAGSSAAGEQGNVQEFFCMQLDHAVAGQDLHKTQERLARHIQQDGGCCLSVSAGQAGMLTHLLLLLQQKQLQRQDDALLLLLQPLSCNTAPAAVSTAAAAADLQPGHPSLEPAAGPGWSAVVQPGARLQHLHCACPTDELSFFAAFMPLHTLLTVEHCSHAAAQAVLDAEAAGLAAGPEVLSAAGPGGPSGANHSSLDAAGSGSSVHSSSRSSSSSSFRSVADQPWSTAESSFEDAVPSVRGASRHAIADRGSSQVLQAARSSGGVAAAVLYDAAARGRLHCARVGAHTDPAAAAASILDAVQAGAVLSLHVREAAAAHATAYTALDLASRGLSTISEQQQPQMSLGFGVLLVPGHSHEHVHAKSHGSVMSMDGQLTPSTVAGVGDVPHQHQHHSRVVTDASMDVGGFGAAFYGLGSWGERGGQHTQSGVFHKHGQEAWLCVVPMMVAA